MTMANFHLTSFALYINRSIPASSLRFVQQTLGTCLHCFVLLLDLYSIMYLHSLMLHCGGYTQLSFAVQQLTPHCCAGCNLCIQQMVLKHALLCAEHSSVPKGWSWPSSWWSWSSCWLSSRSVPHPNASRLHTSRGAEAPLQGSGRCLDQNCQGRRHNGALQGGRPNCYQSYGS